MVKHCVFTHLAKFLPRAVGAWLVVTAFGVSQASETGLRGPSGRGFTGFSVYSATGYQNATVKTTNLRVAGANIALPNRSETTDSSFWLVGLDYTHVFDNRFSLGAQLDYYPKSTQYAISISPGYEVNDRVMGYLRFGWASVPTTVEQGPARAQKNLRLNAYFGGVGTRVNLYRGIFAYAELRYSEVERVDFSSSVNQTVAPGVVVPVLIEGSANTSAINVFLGLGYRF